MQRFRRIHLKPLKKMQNTQKMTQTKNLKKSEYKKDLHNMLEEAE